MLPEQYLLLSLPDHKLASLEVEQHGGPKSQYMRCLNSAGRWAIHGTRSAPLLVWPASKRDEAQGAAERAAKSRGRPIEVASRGNSGWTMGRDIVLFSEASEPALHGYAAQSEGRTRRLRVEAEKLEAFCLVVQAVSAAAGPDELAAVSRAAAKALREKFGGGSVASAFAWLAGRAGKDALASVLAGEIELQGTLTIHQVVAAAELARKAEEIRAGVPLRNAG